MRAIAILCVLCASACDKSPGDAGDMGGPGPSPADLTGIVFAATTIHAIDTDASASAKLIKLEHVVLVTDVDKYVNSVNQQCRYQIWVQDPSCTTPPCGLVVKAIGPRAPSPNATGKDCPGKKTSGTLLATVGRGDHVSLSGRVVVEIDSTAPMTVKEHQLFVDVLLPLPNTSTIDPLPISDGNELQQLVSHSGTAWAKYEGMYVTLKPAAGALRVANLTSSGFQTTPGNSDFGDTFSGDYTPMGVNVFPALGAMFKSISGVVSARHGGEIMPTRNKDFVP